jgi:galactosylgalactosylxylosylprotein 3-beta-glucuronosyltransferase 3
MNSIIVEKPIVKDGKVVGFNSMWRPERPFPIDMVKFKFKLSKRTSDKNFNFRQVLQLVAIF